MNKTTCEKCEYDKLAAFNEPCKSCLNARPNFKPKSEEPNKKKVLVGDITSGYRYVGIDEAARIEEKKKNDEATVEISPTLIEHFSEALRYATEDEKVLEEAYERKVNEKVSLLVERLNDSFCIKHRIDIHALKHMDKKYVELDFIYDKPLPYLDSVSGYRIWLYGLFTKSTENLANEIIGFLKRKFKIKEGNTMPTKYNEMFRKGSYFYVEKDEIKDVIFNNPATIIIWNDGSKTVVKCGEGEVYDPEKGMAMAIAKKFLGNRGNYYDTFKKYLREYEKKKPCLFKDVDDMHEHKLKPTHYTTVKELAKTCGVSESTIRGRLRKGKFPDAIKQDGAWLIPVFW